MICRNTIGAGKLAAQRRARASVITPPAPSVGHGDQSIPMHFYQSILLGTIPDVLCLTAISLPRFRHETAAALV